MFSAQRDEDKKCSSTGSLNSNDGYTPSQQFSSSPLRNSPLLRNPGSSPTLAAALSSTVPASSEFHSQFGMGSPRAMENPTRFLMDEKQKPHLKSYISNSLGRQSPLASKSIPTQLSLSNLRSLNNNVSPLTPDSPMTPHSIGTPHSPAITDVSEVSYNERSQYEKPSFGVFMDFDALCKELMFLYFRNLIFKEH